MGTRRRGWLHNIVSVLNATELFVFKWLMLYYGFHLHPKTPASDNTWYIVFSRVPASETIPPQKEVVSTASVTSCVCCSLHKGSMMTGPLSSCGSSHSTPEGVDQEEGAPFSG